MIEDPKFLVIDLFCGAGGVTIGFVKAQAEGKKLVKVIAAINHDHLAIESHYGNHSDVEHFTEDMRTLNLARLLQIVEYHRRKYPLAKVILWASLECTNFSKAKGGLPRDADSRTLADHLDRYVIGIEPDYVQIENVVEFMSWGPLDENGKPVSRKNGEFFMAWKKRICSYGYRDDWKELNSANYGAYTSRNRLFGIFAKDDSPIVWPDPTHAKKPSTFSMHGDLQKWKAVKDVLDFADEGTSIFTRKKPLVNASLERIYAGLVKFVAKGDTSFISKYFSGKPSGKNITTDGPAGTITTVQTQALVQTEFLVKYNSRGKDGSYSPPSLDDPSPVISTQNRLYLASAQFLANYYGKGGQLSSIDDPSPVIPTKDRISLVQTEFFLDKQYSGYKNNQSIDSPAGTVMPNDKHSLIQAEPFIMPTNYTNGPKSIDEPSPVITANRKHHYLVNPQYKNQGNSVDGPCITLIATMDKRPISLISVEGGRIAIEVYPDDSDVMIRIKQFMVMFEIVDIKMRMLRVHELLKIQGFPDSYKLSGNQSDQKKFIGNAVVPILVTAWTEALHNKLEYSPKKNVA